MKGMAADISTLRPSFTVIGPRPIASPSSIQRRSAMKSVRGSRPGAASSDQSAHPRPEVNARFLSVTASELSSADVQQLLAEYKRLAGYVSSLH